MLHFKRGIQQLRNNRDEAWLFIIDLFMVVLAVLYLAWSLADAIVRTNIFQHFWEANASLLLNEWYNAYTHVDSFYYETFFIAIFLAELLFRWGLAIHRHTYDRWFFYPFIHWYDTLGCIPIDAFKFFRMVRVFAIGYKLHRLNIISLSHSYVFRKGKKYLNILVEEISDKVVVNVISGVQDEIEHGTPITDRILHEVVLPKKAIIVDFLSYRLQQATSAAHAAYEPEIKEYVNKLIAQAVERNREISTIEIIPILGPNITNLLQKAIADIVFEVIQQALLDLASDKNKLLLGEIADISLQAALPEQENEQLNLLARQIAQETLEIVKEQVKVKQWKVQADAERESRRQEKKL